jgi:WD40 repeat protein
MATYQEVLTIDDFRIDISSLTFSPDGKILATGDYAGDVRLWFSATDKEVAQRNR